MEYGKLAKKYYTMLRNLHFKNEAHSKGVKSGKFTIAGGVK